MLTPKSFIAGYGGQYRGSNAMIAIYKRIANAGDAFLVNLVQERVTLSP